MLANLAHVHAARGEWREALDVHGLVLDFDELPPDLAHTTPEQRKWLRGVEYLSELVRGFWEERGYHAVGDPWREERYSYQE